MTKCSVCRRPDHAAIDALLRDGAGRRSVARRFADLSPDAVGRHAKHLDRVEPAALAAAARKPVPAEPEVMVVAAAFTWAGVPYTARNEGDLVEGATLERLKALRCPLRMATAAELRQWNFQKVRHGWFAGVPEPQARLPERPASPLLPADLSEPELLRQLSLRPELLAAQAQRAADAMRRAALIGDHVTVERMAMSFRREAGLSGSLPGQYRAWVAAEEWGWSYTGADKFLAAEARRIATAAVPVAFDPQGFLARLRSDGVDLFIDDTGALRQRGRLHPPDSVLLSTHKLAILDFLKTARVVA